MVDNIEIENRTPHDLVIHRDNNKIVIPPCKVVARVKSEQKVIDRINGIDVVKTEFSDVTGLPIVCKNCERYKKDCPFPEAHIYMTEIHGCEEQKPKKIFVVSSLVAMACKNRKDIVAPDTSIEGAVRDSDGNIIGVKRFQKF